MTLVLIIRHAIYTLGLIVKIPSCIITDTIDGHLHHLLHISHDISRLTLPVFTLAIPIPICMWVRKEVRVWLRGDIGVVEVHFGADGGFGGLHDVAVVEVSVVEWVAGVGAVVVLLLFEVHVLLREFLEVADFVGVGGVTIITIIRCLGDLIAIRVTHEVVQLLVDFRVTHIVVGVQVGVMVIYWLVLFGIINIWFVICVVNIIGDLVEI